MSDDKDKRSLYEAMLDTEPGRHAAAIAHEIYYHSGKLGEDAVRKLTIAQTYLESLALEELRRQVPRWVEELPRNNDQGEET